VDRRGESPYVEILQRPTFWSSLIYPRRHGSGRNRAQQRVGFLIAGRAQGWYPYG